MEQINNLQTIKECSEVLGYELEKIPLLDTSKIILTTEVNPKLLRRGQAIGGANSSSTGTITISAATLNNVNRKTFITAIDASYIKDAACDRATNINVTIVPKGKALTDIIQFPIITLTAQSDSKMLILDYPVELERNTAITFTGSFTAGSMSRTINIWGYQLDPVTNGN